MLVCFVVPGQARKQITADIVELAGAAVDLVSSADIGRLIDEAAAARDFPNASLGELLHEAASATATQNAGLFYTVLVDEPVNTIDAWIGISAAGISVDVIETASANSSQDATKLAYASWNPSDRAGSLVLSNSNLTAVGGSASGVRGTTGFSSGKYYWEVTVDVRSSTQTAIAGVSLATAILTSAAAPGNAVIRVSGSIVVNDVASGVTLGTLAAGAVVCIAVDLTAGLIWFRNGAVGNWNANVANNPATGVGGVSISAVAGTLFPVFASDVTGEKITANFGASAFNGAVPSGFNPGWPS